MSVLTKRQKLTEFIKIADERKIKAIYTLLEDEFESETIEYSNKFKKELEGRLDYYKSGGEMISETASKNEIRKILASVKQK